MIHKKVSLSIYYSILLLFFILIGLTDVTQSDTIVSFSFTLIASIFISLIKPEKALFTAIVLGLSISTFNLLFLNLGIDIPRHRSHIIFHFLNIIPAALGCAGGYEISIYLENK